MVGLSARVAHVSRTVSTCAITTRSLMRSSACIASSGCVASVACIAEIGSITRCVQSLGCIRYVGCVADRGCVAFAAIGVTWYCPVGRLVCGGQSEVTMGLLY